MQSYITMHRGGVLPKRIILVRHGESQGNLDTAAYTTTPDHKIDLTPNGIDQARVAGARMRGAISGDASSPNWRVYFYVSPYARTRSTLREIGRSFSKKRVIGVREECRIREQDFGNFQEQERMDSIMEARIRYGRFYYRFPEGESTADVFDRVSSFLESLWRDIDMNRLNHDPSDDLNLIIVSHGLASRVFLMKWFKWTVKQFELLNNLGNCEFRVMQLGSGGEYSLAVHHTEQELIQWGLSPDMIADQKWRACASKGSWNDQCSWYLDAFFDYLPDSDDENVDNKEEINSLSISSNCETSFKSRLTDGGNTTYPKTCDGASTNKPCPTRWDWLHGSNNIIMSYQGPCLQDDEATSITIKSEVTTADPFLAPTTEHPRQCE